MGKTVIALLVKAKHQNKRRKFYTTRKTSSILTDFSQK